MRIEAAARDRDGFGAFVREGPGLLSRRERTVAPEPGAG